ncbi:hypothetical protein LPJ66_004241 [Kickxella alabastrina]|uniref:Uncharacterized protein n=1 Tax=Kickxella alabastrina TaxID=61397 RepID=A0ACC1IIH7_9FUNG|nr:hypothetical protein LPJ66_004241 [Kickxella alabastrina]
MDYRAAATRQLKEGAPAGSPASSKGGAAVTVQPAAAPAPTPAATTAPAPAPVTNATPNATTLGVAASGDLNKMKANASGKTNGNSTNNKKTTNFGGSAPLSYAATAAAKKLAATTSAATAAAAAAAAAISAASASVSASALDSAPAAGVSGTESSSIAVARKNGSVCAAPSQPLTSLVNAKVCLTLVNGSTVEGVVFTYDVYSGVVALISETTSDALAEQQQLGQSNGSPSLGGNAKQQQQQQRTQIHIIKAANIKDLQVTDKSGDLVLPEVRPVATSVIEARKQRSILQARERAARIGVGVSDVAQSIFEALSRTLPCRWSQNKIVVLDEVVIESPYGVENCRELASGSFSLQRVKKVLQGELNRIAAAQTASTAAAT